MNFTKKTVIITGASTGIGRALALSLAQRGASLVLAARNQTALEETVAICVKQGGTAIAVSTDVTQPEACQYLVEAALQKFGQIDSLVNNAGISMLSRFDEVTELSLFEQVMRVNYLGAVYCTYYALPYLKASQGLLVAISSLFGKTGVPTRSGYVASKHAMQGFFDTLRIELWGTGVDVLVVSPGFVATDIRHQALGANGNPLGKSLRDESKETMPVNDCVHQIVWAMERRKREQVITLKGKIAPWVKLVAPGLADRIAALSAQVKNYSGNEPTQ